MPRLDLEFQGDGGKDPLCWKVSVPQISIPLRAIPSWRICLPASRETRLEWEGVPACWGWREQLQSVPVPHGSYPGNRVGGTRDREWEGEGWEEPDPRGEHQEKAQGSWAGLRGAGATTAPSCTSSAAGAGNSLWG